MTFTSNYNHLNIPDQWNEYFSKYPNGYTILEAVINWAGQVNDMVDTLNNTEDYVNNFMTTFDTDLDTTTQNILTQWENDGTLGLLLSNSVSSKLSHWVTVTDYISDGETDDTSAFQSAVDNCVVNSTLTNTELPVNKALSGTVFVPSGQYTITSEIDSKNNYITFVLQNGAEITGIDYLDGKVYLEGERISTNTFSNYDDGTGFAIRVNPPTLEQQAEIFGVSTMGQFGTTQEIGSVGLFVDNTAPNPLVTITNASFTSNSVICSPPLTSLQMKQLKKGMAIRTTNTTPCASFVDSWASDGTSITVSTGWYPLTGSTSSPITPVNGSTVYVNTPDKIWGLNANVTLQSGSPVNKTAGFELGFLNNSGVPMIKDGDMTKNPYSWGFDAISLSTSKMTSGHIARGQMFEGFLSSGQDNGFRVRKDNTNTNIVGFVYEAEGIPFLAKTNNGANYFQVSNGGNIEMGKQDTVQTTTLDFHSSGTTIDYDTRISSSGGNGTTVGQGTLALSSALVTTNAPIRPTSNNTIALGSPTMMYSEVYANEVSPNMLALFPMSSSSVTNGRLFVDSADSKLKFKDNTGTVNLLY